MLGGGQGGFDKEKLVNDFVSLLGAMEQAAGGASPFQQGPSAAGHGGGGGSSGGGFQGGWGDEPLDHIPGGTVDRFSNYEELVLDDGRILRRYDTGAVRVENPTSGVIQEERVDGSLVISLPNGKVLFQEFRGEPLLVYDTERGGPPGLARVSSAQLPGETQPKFVFHFQDFEGSHLVELESLRYYRVRRQAMAAGG